MLKPTTSMYMGTEFDPAEKSKLISYLDALWMSNGKKHPTSEFKWMTDDELDDWKHLSCILEVDFEYPQDLHDLHNDYPLAPQRVKLEM